MLCYAIYFRPNPYGIPYTKIHGIPGNFTGYNMYEFEDFRYKFGRIKYKISGLVEVESASFFLSPLFANPLIYPTESVR
jgi:hypothetical protein